MTQISASFLTTIPSTGGMLQPFCRASTRSPTSTPAIIFFSYCFMLLFLLRCHLPFYSKIVSLLYTKLTNFANFCLFYVLDAHLFTHIIYHIPSVLFYYNYPQIYYNKKYCDIFQINYSYASEHS